MQVHVKKKQKKIYSGINYYYYDTARICTWFHEQS